MWSFVLIFSCFAMETNFRFTNQTTGRIHFSNLSWRQRTALKNYECSLVHLGRLKNQREFLMECKKEQVVPKTLEVSLRNSESPFPATHREILADRILYSKRQVNHAFWCSRRSYSALCREFSHNLRSGVVCIARNTAQRKNSAHRYKLINKLRRICQSSKWNEFSNTRNIVNLSGVRLHHNENIVLGLGLSFNTQPDVSNLIPTAASLDGFITWNKSRFTNQDLVRGLVSPMLMSIRDQSPLLPKRFNEALSSLAQRKNIKILPADKGGRIVILDDTSFRQKA